MRGFFLKRLIILVLIPVGCTYLIAGCDSGEKAIDEFTGKRAVKQYQKSKKDIEKIADKQEERYKNLPNDDDK